MADERYRELWCTCHQSYPCPDQIDSDGLFKNRNCMHRNMAPLTFCDECTGRGYIIEEEGERYCDCKAGAKRREVENG